MCVFCQIINKQSPAHIVYEDSQLISFLDIEPIHEGHILIVPKQHVDSIDKLSDDTLAHIINVAKKIVVVLKEIYGNEGYSIMQNGGKYCDFGHAHFHVFPRYDNDGFGWTYPEGESEYSEKVAGRILKRLEEMNNFIIRNEQTGDYRKVEEIHRDAFWNLHVPGCNEHYLAHVLRAHEDFIPELDYVCELDGQVVANVMYTKSKLVDEQGNKTDILTFGPIGVAPEVQRRGIGKALLEKTFHEAVNMGYKAIVIFGNPDNYVTRGFRSCKRYNVCLEGDVFPAALLVKELEQNFFDGRKYYFYGSVAYEINDCDAEAFDKDFEYREKAFQSSQEEFYIHSHSIIR